MNTFKNTEYTITTSLSDQSASIYIKIANNISYSCYEGTFEKQAFRLSFELAGIYRLINKCFDAFISQTEDPKYSVAFELESNSMCLAFRCAIEEFLVIDFETRLREKTVSGDSIMSAELEKQTQLVKMLREQVDKQSTEIEELEKQNKCFETELAQTKSEHDELVEEHDELVEEHDELVEEHDELVEEHDELVEEFNKLRDDDRQQYEKLRLKYNELVEEYEKLRLKYNELVEEYNKLNEKLRLKYNELVGNFNKQTNALSNAYNVLVDHKPSDTNVSNSHYIYRMDAIKIEIVAMIYSGSHINPYYQKINLFYNLELLILRRYRFPDLTQFSNSTVKTIQIDCFCEQPTITSLRGLENFPELEYLEIHNNRGLVDVVGPLTAYKHKITNITFVSCGGFNVAELNMYCQNNYIALTL